VHTSTTTLLRRRQDQLVVKSTLSLTKKSVPELNDQPSCNCCKRGGVLSAYGVSPDTNKVKAIKTFPLPQNVQDVRSLLAMAVYYWSFIKNFAAISTPLTLLTMKDAKFKWSEPQQRYFDALKEEQTSDSVLANPELSQITTHLNG